MQPLEAQDLEKKIFRHMVVQSSGMGNTSTKDEFDLSNLGGSRITQIVSCGSACFLSCNSLQDHLSSCFLSLLALIVLNVYCSRNVCC
jgi:hypothetical protein